MSVTMRWIDTWIKNPGSLYYSRKKQKGKKNNRPDNQNTRNLYSDNLARC